MKKDITTKGLLEHGDVFADIANVNLFGGRPVLRPEDLEAVPIESGYKDLQGTYHALMRDCLQKVHKLGSYIAFIGYENQTGISNIMPVRDMGYTYTAYMKQIWEIMAENERQKKPAYVKGIHDDQKLWPVITCILYFGKKPWNNPLSLLDMLNIPEEEQDFWKEMVGDYRIHVIPMVKQPQEVRNQYRSDFKIIADYLAYYYDKKQLVQMWKQNTYDLVHKEQVWDTLYAFAGKERMEEMEELFMDEYEEEEAPFAGHGSIIEYIKGNGKRETIIEFLEELGTIPEELKLKIENQEDKSALRTWIKFAAKAASIEEFAKLIEE